MATHDNSEICIKVMVRINGNYLLDFDICSGECEFNVKYIGSNGESNKIVTNVSNFKSATTLNMTKGVNYIIIYPVAHKNCKLVINNFSISMGGRVHPHIITSTTFNVNQVELESGIDFYNTDITNDILDAVYENIDNFTNKINNYKNILFICTDYPDHGGASTNCYNLQQFYSVLHNTYCVFYTNEQINEYHNNYCVINTSNFEKVVRNLTFIPDLIILKNFVPIKLKKIFDCPIYFCVPGIFSEHLDKYYYELDTLTEHNMYICSNVLDQIANSDESFCNSSHTRDILYNMYGFKTSLFYCTFIKYCHKAIIIDKEFLNRKYDYALIVSIFNRKIKNVMQSINFLKDKKNVVLIGKGSDKYSYLGFECREHIANQEIEKIMKNTKCIIQDSFYESCSNVKIEASFNGCLIYSSFASSNV